MSPPLQTLLSVLILLSVIKTMPLMAASSHPQKDALHIESAVDLGVGYESNVFLGDQKNQSDWYTLLDASLEGFFQANKRSLIFGFLNATFQDFFQYNQADELFANFALQYRYRLNGAYTLGVSNTLSYTDLMLLDSEGDALPINQFESISDQLRLFGIYHYSRTFRIEFGAFHRIFNVKEIGAEPSLDFKESGGDLSSKQVLSEHWTSKIRYRIKDISYNTRQANNRETSFDGSFDTSNPVLRLRRQELDIKFDFDNDTSLEGNIKAKYRINTDRFEDDLSYRQVQLKGQLAYIGFDFAIVDAALYYANRNYGDRKNALGSDQTLKETYFIGEITFSNEIHPGLSPYIKFEISTKTSNDPTNEYNNLQNTLGLKARW